MKLFADEVATDPLEDPDVTVDDAADAVDEEVAVAVVFEMAVRLICVTFCG